MEAYALHFCHWLTSLPELILIFKYFSSLETGYKKFNAQIAKKSRKSGTGKLD